MFAYLFPANENVLKHISYMSGVKITYKSTRTDIVGVESESNIYHELCELVGQRNVLIDEPQCPFR